jgi:ERCC4-type nuclease
MLIKIDVREQELFKSCSTKITTTPNIQLLSETLPLGDIIINDGTSDCIIIERKTLSDLAASIKDGRYEEQSYRLNGLQHHNHNIVYLIEGDIDRFNTFKDRIDKKTLYSAMFSINYFKGFSVMRSNSLDETATIVCNMAYKVEQGKISGRLGFYSNTLQLSSDGSSESKENNGDQEKSDKDYCKVVKKVKKDNITPDNIGEIMLCQIPGISTASAIAILGKFKTLPGLIQALKDDPNCLNDICTTDASGKSRKISKAIISSIFKFL